MTNQKMNCQPLKIMEIAFRNFAKAGTGSVRINDLTVIYGPNNSGKTYIGYAIFAILENLEHYFDVGLSNNHLKKLVEKLISHGSVEIDVTKQIYHFSEIIAKIENEITANLHNYFSLRDDFFADSKFSVLFDKVNLDLSKNILGSSIGGFLSVDFLNKVNKKKVIATLMEYDPKAAHLIDSDWLLTYVRWMTNQIVFDALLRELVPIPFPVTSERTGISLFHKVFDNKNKKILDKIVTSDPKEISMIKQVIPNYALPIQRDIEKIQYFEGYLKKRSFITRAPKKYEDLLTNLSDLVAGSFSSTNGAVFYHPNETANHKNHKIPLHATSSSVKALFALDIFINHLASLNEKQILIIDEPELNLHPRKQIIMARLIAGLVNAGVKVLITTHSDFIVREISNLVMLNSADKKYKKHVMKNHCFNECEILDHKRISVYNTTDDLAVQEVEVDRYGINSKMFDDVITDENKRRNEVSEIMEEENEG